MESEDKQNQPVELSTSMESAAATLAARCYQDADFARKLRENPRAVIEELSGKKLPESLAIEVHENDGRTWHVPLPDQASGTLSDEQLGTVSGGFEIWITCLVVGTVAAVAVGGGVAAAVLNDQDN